MNVLELIAGAALYVGADFATSRLEPLRLRAGATMRSRRRAQRARLFVASGVSLFLGVLVPSLIVGDVLLALAAALLVWALLVRVPPVHERTTTSSAV